MANSIAPRGLVVITTIVASALVLHAPRAEAGCDTSQSYDANTWQSCNTDTAGTVGTTGSTGNCYGRCGPGCSWSFLGNRYTTACQNHDWCVRQGLKAGRSNYSAHANCVSSLGSAARSYYSYAWHTWKGKLRDKVTGFVSNWL